MVLLVMYLLALSVGSGFGIVPKSNTFNSTCMHALAVRESKDSPVSGGDLLTHREVTRNNERNVSSFARSFTNTARLLEPQ